MNALKGMSFGLVILGLLEAEIAAAAGTLIIMQAVTGVEETHVGMGLVVLLVAVLTLIAGVGSYAICDYISDNCTKGAYRKGYRYEQ